MCIREDSFYFFQFIPCGLFESIICSTYDILTYEQLLSYLPLDNPRARKTGARLLAQLELSKSHAL